MMKALLPAAVLMFMFSGKSFAADDTTKKEGEANTSMKIEEAKPDSEKNKVSSGGDVDEIITNKKMRAESGSKSKWSIGTAFQYSGGTIETPLSAKRPNLTGGNGIPANASFTGSVGVGYKMTATDRLSLDTGVYWIAPLEAHPPKGSKGEPFTGKRVEASNPSVTYSKAYKIANRVQSILSVGPTLYTQTKNNREYGYQYAFSVAQNNIYEIGHTGLSVGLYVNADYLTFDKNDLISKSNSSDYDFGAAPFLEYVINETFNLRTVFNFANFEHPRIASTKNTYFKSDNQESVGLGISMTRDIFLYPNIQFRPRDITHIFRADQTNVALAANINIF